MSTRKRHYLLISLNTKRLDHVLYGGGKIAFILLTNHKEEYIKIKANQDFKKNYRQDYYYIPKEFT